MQGFVADSLWLEQFRQAHGCWIAGENDKFASYFTNDARMCWNAICFESKPDYLALITQQRDYFNNKDEHDTHLTNAVYGDNYLHFKWTNILGKTKKCRQYFTGGTLIHFNHDGKIIALYDWADQS